MKLDDLHDADRRATDPITMAMAAQVPVPHPLSEVVLTDGRRPWTAPPLTVRVAVLGTIALVEDLKRLDIPKATRHQR